MFSAVEVVMLTVIAAAIAAYAQYLFKKAVPKFKMGISGAISLAKNRTILAAVIVYVAGLAFYLAALGSGQLSFVYPAFSSTFIFVIIISHFMLHEKIGYTRLAGILLIILGIFIVSVGSV